MNKLLIDNPLITSILFHPRQVPPGYSMFADAYAVDGTIASDGEGIGYRLFPCEDAKALLLFFHGNAEIAADYDPIAAFYQRVGLALLVVDYRGFGWSTGKATASNILSDAENLLDALPQTLAKHNIDTLPLFIFGRSLGSAPSIHLAHKSPQTFKGLILDSAFAHAPSLLSTLGLPEMLVKKLPPVFENAQKMREIKLPLLLIHGENDTLIRIRHAEELYEASAAENKKFMRVPLAGHNDLIARTMEEYFTTIRAFVDGVLAS
jgi:alpha-beta hydrolase superfamily lysophospholipase